MSSIPGSERTDKEPTYCTKSKHLRMKLIEYLEMDFGTDKAYLPDKTPNPRYWLIKKIRDNIYDLAQDMMRCLIATRTIYIYHVYEYNERRRYFTQAIADLESILQELYLNIDYLGIKPSKYEKLIPIINECIAAIKNRRQADNPIRVQVLERDAKEKLRIEKEIKG